MTTLPDPPPSLDEEVEMARQLILHQRLSEEMGGILPEQIDLSSIHHVLDIACGSGGWVLDLAGTYPHLHVMGIDASPLLLEYGRAQSWKRGLHNAAFHVHDMQRLHTSFFSSTSYDLIHLAFSTGAILTLDYPQLIHDLFLLSHPGGTFCWTECEFPVTTSASLEHLTTLICQALQQAGQRFVPSVFEETSLAFNQCHQAGGQERLSSSRQHLGITAMMGWWLRDAGWQDIQHIPYAIDVSAGTDMHQCFFRQAWLVARRVKPFLVGQSVLSEHEFEDVFEAMQKELQHESFSGMCFLRTILGRKPDE